MTNISLTIHDQTYTATLNENPATEKLMRLLPLKIKMTDLNRNEKYHTLDTTFPTQQEAVQQIHSGDLMLYDNDTIVLFYQDFSTPYTYTRLGKLIDATSLSDHLGYNDVTVTIAIAE
ncbi:hypothetical protein TP70_05275 [Staphylococcus microti]|uniref:Uncharacterized conserved protein n=1 Tax=Staphylococcus microti TaxID=569857 RepID=A0A0D6XR27_9STAP|nr:cyclophilin-like fold protein [Staphylococcus microti]KIX90890.1 hypothetical protein TP70_05275 [Staphylococcus microti]PNZ79860.1 hypothetical protein CD132_09495 [Staphylococcus microti]SUM58540.1 Uncharacterized conserved protein [Staphylococcus microti]